MAYERNLTKRPAGQIRQRKRRGREFSLRIPGWQVTSPVFCTSPIESEERDEEAKGRRLRCLPHFSAELTQRAHAATIRSAGADGR